MPILLPSNDDRKRTVLCYGSSTTWGYDPQSGSRFSEQARWPCVMGIRLGSGFEVIEEGFNGRTVLDHIPHESPANGYQYLDSLLERVVFDFIIIMLGINDLFADRDVSVKQIAGGIEKMIHSIKFKMQGSAIIIVSPPQIHEDFEAAYLYQIEIEKSRKLAHEYKHTAAGNICLFADAGKIVSNSPVDGIHLEEKDQVKLGSYLADFISLSI